MIIIFKGNNYKYEIEAVMKLFIPLKTFSFVYDDSGGSLKTPDPDTCSVIRGINPDGSIRLSVNVYLGGKNASEELTVASGEDDELILCRLLFFCMNKLTGISPPWGFLTGIRPVKKVNELLCLGYNKQEIFDILREKYYVSDSKLELAYNTAVTQSVYLKSLNEKSFSLYVSVPFCPSRCAYCSFVSHSVESRGAKSLIPQYLLRLCEEIDQISEIAQKLNMKLDTVYIGGGTPTTLSAEKLEILMQNIQKNFNISEIREYTVEAGRCDTITADKLDVIKKYGATRISINPQTMNDDVLKAIGRRHTAGDVISSFNLVRSLGFNNINMDTIAGLPNDTYEGFKNTIDILCGLSPESITVHTLTLKRSSALFSVRDLKFEDCVSGMIEYGYSRLSETGYLPYYLYRQKNTVQNLENVGYAKKGFECIYNILIMEETQTILAAGASGSSKLVDLQTGKIERIFGYKYPYEHISGFGKLTEKKKKILDFFS